MSTPWPTDAEGRGLLIGEMDPAIARELIAEASARSRAKVRAGRHELALAAPADVCWEHQDGAQSLRLPFSVRVF